MVSKRFIITIVLIVARKVTDYADSIKKFKPIIAIRIKKSAKKTSAIERFSVLLRITFKNTRTIWKGPI